MKNRNNNKVLQQTLPQGKFNHVGEVEMSELSFNAIYYNTYFYTKIPLSDLND